MGFFKDFKQDLSQAVNELTEDAANIVGGNEKVNVSEDDVMVDTLSDSSTDEIEEMDVEAMLKSIEAEESLAEEKVENIIEESEAKQAAYSEDIIPEEEVVETPVEEEITETPVEKEIAETPVEEEIAETPVEEEEQIVFEDSIISDEVTIISRGLKIKGDVESCGSIELLGEVEGNVSCRGKLKANGKITGNTHSSDFFSDKAEIRGDICCDGTVKIGSGTVIIGNLHAKSAVIAGAIKGEIDVHGPVIVDSTAIVMGDIKSESFQINGGAVLDGYISQCYSDHSPKIFFADK